MSEWIDKNDTVEFIVPEKMNILQRFGNLIFSPKKLFAFIRKKPTIIFPIILIVILAVLTQLLMWEPTRDLQVDLTYNSYKSMGMNYTPDQIEQMVDLQMGLTVAFSPLGYLTTWVVMTLVLYLIFRIVKCEKGLKKYFSMIGYITVISLIGQLIHAAYLYFTGGDLMGGQVTAIASFLNKDMTNPYLYAIASQIEVFSIWAFILYGIGFVYTGGVEKRKSYITTTILFLLISLAGAGITVLSSQFLSNVMGSLAGQ